MSRILIEVQKEKLLKLDSLAKHENVSRSFIIRLAIDKFLTKHYENNGMKNAFGILKDKNSDSLKIQKQYRDEWPS